MSLGGGKSVNLLTIANDMIQAGAYASHAPYAKDGREKRIDIVSYGDSVDSGKRQLKAVLAGVAAGLVLLDDKTETLSGCGGEVTKRTISLGAPVVKLTNDELYQIGRKIEKAADYQVYPAQSSDGKIVLRGEKGNRHWDAAVQSLKGAGLVQASEEVKSMTSCGGNYEVRLVTFVQEG